MKLKEIAQEAAASTATTSDSRWERIANLVNQSLPSATSPGDHSPSFTTLDLNDLKLYGTTPLELGPAGHALFKCKECGRPVLENALSDHQVNCQTVMERKLLKQSSLTGVGSGGRKRRLSDASTDSSNNLTKKSKITLVLNKTNSQPTLDPGSKKILVTLGKGMSEREKNERALIAARVAKPRDPVNFDKQCGVINDKNLPCSRSLTCKTHSMGAKRSVPRSQPYDILLHEVQRVTHPDKALGRPVQPRVGPGSAAGNAMVNGVGERRRSGTKVDLERRKPSTTNVSSSTTRFGEVDESEDEGEEGEGMIDSDEEVEGVLKGLNNVIVRGGRPLSLSLGTGNGGWSGGKTSFFVERNAKMARLRQVFGGVFGGASS